MKIFLDTEFTGLHQKTTLISLAMVAENGEEFYAEFNDYDYTQINEWLEENVIPKLLFSGQEKVEKKSGQSTFIKGTSIEIVIHLSQWLAGFDHIEIWADVLAYDWVLFCELFGGALTIPENIFFAPFDLATFFKQNGYIKYSGGRLIDFNRFNLVGKNPKLLQHNALEDARVEKLCYNLITNLK